MTAGAGNRSSAGTAEAADSPLSDRVRAFAAMLRDEGFRSGVGETLDALRVAERVGILDQRRLRGGLRSLLCSDPDEWKRFDRLFDAFWKPPNRRGHVQATPGARLQGQGSGPQGRRGVVAEMDGSAPGSDPHAGGSGTRGGASRREGLAGSDFRMLVDEQQMRAAEQLAERLARRMRRHILRRQQVARHGRRIHLRRTIHRSLQYGGVPVDLAWRRRRRQLPRLVLLLDVSRSMSLYSLFFLRFARGVVAAFRDAHAFAFHTRLVPITDALGERDPERLRDKLAVLSLGWSGGTRIGESLAAFNDRHGKRLLGARTVVVIVSDGFDTGPPETLAEQLAAMRGRVRKLVWLNPLLGREGYEPTSQGMQAALPLLDVFGSAHNLDSLVALEDQLTR